MQRLRAAREERGAYAILFAVLIVVILIMVAMAVDLSDARARVRESQTRSDAAGIAAGAHLPGDPMAACRAAWIALKTNTPDLPSGPTVTSPCEDAGFVAKYGPGGTGCDPALSEEFRALNTEPYEVIFTYPVTDAALQAMSPSDRQLDADFEGDPCERMGITVVKGQGALFGGIVGGQGIQAPATSVVRGFARQESKEIAALIILDPVACNVLVTGGQGFVDVRGAKGFNDEGVPVSSRGIIAVDSLANGGSGSNSCTSGNTRAIDVLSQNINNFIKAGPDPATGELGFIAAHGMAPGQVGCSTGNLRVCDPDDILLPPRLDPVPTRAELPVTRSPVDYRYNCNESYPLLTIEGCLTATAGSVAGPPDGDTDYIDKLVADVGSGGLPGGLFDWLPVSLQGWRDYLTDPAVVRGDGTTLTGDRCSPSANRVIVPAGNWFVNCTGPQGFNPGNRVDFEGVAGANNVVFQGKVRPGNDAEVSFNVTDANLPLDDPGKCPDDSPGPAQPGAFVYVRNSDFVMSGPSNLVLCNSLLYVRDGVVAANTSGTVFSWIAPFDGVFEDLALWSEGTGKHLLGGQTALNIEGVFFTPNATPFAFDGQPLQAQNAAQFFTHRLDVSGQGGLKMTPDPARSIPIRIQGFYLIR